MLYILIILLVLIDQGTKFLVTQNIEPFLLVPVIDNFFYLTHVLNSGGAFSLLAQTDWGIFVLAGISFLVSMILLYFIYRLRNKDFFLIRLSLAVLVGGTIGNMIDRIRTRAVVDFLMFRFGSFTFPIFNFADICVVLGAISLAFLLLKDKRLLAEKKDMLPASKEGEHHES